MKKKTYIRPVIKVCALHARPIMNVGSFSQSPIDGGILENSDDDTEYWGY